MLSKVIIGISPLESSVKIKNVPEFLDQWYDKRKKKCILKVQNSKPFGLACNFTQDDMELGTIRWRGIMALFMIWRSWTIHQVPSFSFTGSIGVLHGKLVVTYSLQAKNLSIIVCTSWAFLLRECCFQLGKWVGSQRVMTNDSAQCAHPGVPWAHTWGLALLPWSLIPFCWRCCCGSSSLVGGCRSWGGRVD